LFQQIVGGLQVFNTEKRQFLDVPDLEDCIVVNIGDLLQMWTDSLLISAQHRVVSPPSPWNQSDRYSIAFFLHPMDKEEVIPLKLENGTDNRSLSERQRMARLAEGLPQPFTAAEYLDARLNNSYKF
jgi:isopenicillin N synthase-like dioxygenase